VLVFTEIETGGRGLRAVMKMPVFEVGNSISYDPIQIAHT